MKKKWIAALVGVCMAVLTCACTVEPEKPDVPAPTEKKEPEEDEAELAKQAKLDLISPSAYGDTEGLDVEPATYFSLIGKGSSEEYWKMVKAGAEAAVADLNKALDYEGGDKVKVVYSGPGESDNVDEQVNILDEELARYPSALGIAVIDSQSCNVQFDLAVQNSIPIITYDSLSSYQGIMANITTDNKKAGAEAAVHMAEELGEEGQALIFAHDSRSLTCRQRAESFAAEIKENHSEMSTTEIYYMDRLDELKEKIARERVGLPSDDGAGEEEPKDSGLAEGTLVSEPEPAKEDLDEAEVPEEALQEITDEEALAYIFEKNPEIKGIFATNGQAAMQMADLCTDQEKEDIAIIGYDSDTEEIEALKEGRLAGLVVQNPYGMGYAAIVAEARCVLEIGNEAEIDTGYIWVDEENLDSKEVQRMLYIK